MTHSNPVANTTERSSRAAERGMAHQLSLGKEGLNRTPLVPKLGKRKGRGVNDKKLPRPD